MYGPIATAKRRRLSRRLIAKYQYVDELPINDDLPTRRWLLDMHNMTRRFEGLEDAWKALPWYVRMWLTVTGQDRHWFD